MLQLQQVFRQLANKKDRKTFCNLLEVLDSLGGLGANKYPACRALVVKLKPYRLPHIA